MLPSQLVDTSWIPESDGSTDGRTDVAHRHLGSWPPAPGRPHNPIRIEGSEIGEWTSHDHLMYARIRHGKYAGNILWWDGFWTYKLDNGLSACLD